MVSAGYWGGKWGEEEGGEKGGGGAGGKRVEMTQTLYAHMNKRNKKQTKKIEDVQKSRVLVCTVKNQSSFHFWPSFLSLSSSGSHVTTDQYVRLETFCAH
jgi:hypothetical protein